MSSPVTRSSVLGKRPHNPEPSTPAHTDTKRQLQTPDNTPNPKRPRTSITALDGDGNKENVPPFNTEPIASPPSPRATRSLRRTTTSDGSPSRVRHGMFCSMLLCCHRSSLASSSGVQTRLDIRHRAVHADGRDRAAHARNSSSYSPKLASTHPCACACPFTCYLQ